MTPKEFMDITGISSRKTAYWIHKQAHNGTDIKNNHGHRVFDDYDIDYYNSRLIENYTDGRLVQIPNYSKYYVSDTGHVYRTNRGFLEEVIGSYPHGYHAISMTDDFGNIKYYKVHRLVASIFIPNPLNKPDINHIDGNKANNHYLNLEWVTSSENMIHAFTTGLAKNSKGFDDSQSCPVVYIDNNGIFHVYGSISIAAKALSKHKSNISRAAKANQNIINLGFPIELMCNAFIYYDNIKNKCNEYQQVIFENERC